MKNKESKKQETFYQKISVGKQRATIAYIIVKGKKHLTCYMDDELVWSRG